MTAENEAIAIGGLMRCCVDTLRQRTEPATDGEVQPCTVATMQGHASMIFRERPVKGRPDARGIWEWNREDDPDDVYVKAW